MAQRKRNKKSFIELSDAEKTESAKEFDHPSPAGRFKPLTRKQRLLWNRARASKPDVSIYVHQGQVEVRIDLDPDLMAQARAYAAKNKTSLPKMIDRGLRGLLAYGS